MSNSPDPIAPALLAWHDAHGRHDLPWQVDRTPYRVWVSEVMLQQTQVSAVIPYFHRFMERFPDVAALADAPADEVLHRWSGLGYYARARNLQKAAQRIRDFHRGEFPTDFDAVAALPGVGRSTAGAILALACDQRHPILDGNVRRVLSRLFAVPGRSGERQMEARLWTHADELTPAQRVAQYTQAIMDLGATVCVRRHPHCGECPFEGRCAAHAAGTEHAFPAPKKPLKRRAREVWMLLARRADGSVRLVRRPPVGIWGGLWSPPEFATRADAQGAWQPGGAWNEGEPLQHAFTHFDLLIRPLWADLPPGFGAASAVGDEPEVLWYNAARPARVGLPAPIIQLLQSQPLQDPPP